MHITQNSFLKTAFKPLISVTKWLGKNNPETLVKIRYFVRFHKFLNLDNPKTLNEKILYLSLRTDTTEWTRLSDKYNVRKYVEDCGLKENLVQLYAHWTNENEIDFSSLPDSYVIKSAQGCGDIILVKDKKTIDESNIREKLKPMLSERYGALEGGKHYLRIEPAVIVEELLPIENGQSLTDYKIWCFNGKPEFILTCSNRFKDGVHLGSYDKYWNYRPSDMMFSKEHLEEKEPLVKPENLDKMLEVAEKLAKPFPCVRVDLYNINGTIYFGEMTFTSLGGLMDYYTDEFQKLAGSQIDLSKVKVIR